LFLCHRLAVRPVVARGAPPSDIPAEFSFVPTASNQPVGTARGIFPGRVVWARDPLAAHWAGTLAGEIRQWWLDANTDQTRVTRCSTPRCSRSPARRSAAQSWQAIFEYYKPDRPPVGPPRPTNRAKSWRSRSISTTATPRRRTIIRTSRRKWSWPPVRQLVNSAHVRPEDVLIYDVRRDMPPYLLTKVWSEFKDVRFYPERPPRTASPRTGLRGSIMVWRPADWVARNRVLQRQILGG